MNGELPQDARERIADILRDVADEIEETETFGTFTFGLDTEQYSRGRQVQTAINAREYELNLLTNRFEINAEIYDEKVNE